MKSIRMGLVLDRHLDQLAQIMDHGRKVFARREAAADFFGSLETVVHLEKQRRHHGMEGQWDESPWQYDLERLSPSSQVCLHEFFVKKQEEFQDSEPPVAAFFKQVADQLDEHMARTLPEGLREDIENARRSVVNEEENGGVRVV